MFASHKLPNLFTRSVVAKSCIILLLAEAILVHPSFCLQDENKYDTDLSVTHLDIFFKTDFESNTVDTVVKATVENFSHNIVDKAEFWLCPGMNDFDFGADIKHIYLLDKNEKRSLKHTLRTTKDIYSEENEWEIYEVTFSRIIYPGEELILEFDYTMKGNPDHSSTPIWQSKDGPKELYLRGEDWLWCPSLYVKQKKRMYPRLYKPSWKLNIEYPEGYVAIADGKIVSRAKIDGIVKEEWESVINGHPHAYISKYKVNKRSSEGLILEVYAPDEEVLKKIEDRFDDYARILNLYVKLYGHPGSSIYRIVGSPVLGSGGTGMAMGQVIPIHRLKDISLVAHEMAHTWWGNLVYSYGEGTKFLREAMAEFSNNHVRSLLGEEDCLDNNWILLEKRRYFCRHFAVSTPVKLYPLIQQEGYDPQGVMMSNYQRGPLVLNQIRLTLGNEVFFNCLRAFAMKYKGKTVDIHDFIDTINHVSGRDMTSEIKGLLWSTGYPSYRLAGFESTKMSGGYRTRVKIQNEGEYGLTCPLLLKMRVGEKQEIFKVEGQEEREFEFTTKDKVTDAVIDPELTTFQYHPEQKVRLWMALKPGGLNWVWYGQSYMYYSQGDYKKAIDTITEYFSFSMEREKAKNMEELLEKHPFKTLLTAYLFMRGIYHLELNDTEHAEEDIKMAFPYMLDAVLQGESVVPPTALFYQTGAIPERDMEQYLTLLKQIAEREFTFEKGLDEEAKKHKVEQWKLWWENKGKYQKLALGALKERFASTRMINQSYR